MNLDKERIPLKEDNMVLYLNNTHVMEPSSKPFFFANLTGLVVGMVMVASRDYHFPTTATYLTRRQRQPRPLIF